MLVDQKPSPASTPLFLVWALSQSCPVKEPLESFQSSNVDLLRLERAFRPIRSLAIAESEDRIWNDICIMQSRNQLRGEVDHIKAFSIEEVLTNFGGEEFLKHHCSQCDCNVFDQPADSNEHSRQRQYAGCYGYLQSVYGEVKLFADWQAELDGWAGEEIQEINDIKRGEKNDCRLEKGCRLDRIWRTREPEQPRVWSEEQKRLLLKLLTTGISEGINHPDLSSLAQALELSLRSGVAIQILVVPEAKIIDRQWIVPQHCSNCIHPLESWAGQCPICGSTSPPNSQRKRHLKGDRPYWPLVRFVGTEEATRIASDYFAETDSIPKANE